MPVKRVFVDGSAGTTGLNIIERLSGRNDIELLALPEELRKDEASRKQMINEADIVFLCLPDQAAKEAASWLENPSTRVIDTSTAHRVHPDWTYGFPELTGQRNAIADARLVANPGCHASGFIALVRPLTENCLIAKDLPLSCFSLTGYSGGGKKMIAEYEAAGRSPLLDAPRMYGLNQSHKHLPEMKHVCGLAVEPVFCPIVAPYYAGMEVTVPLFRSQTSASPSEIAACYEAYYRSGLVRYAPADGEGGFLSASALAGTDEMHVSVCGNDERILLVARFDNLGKGACGAAIQNMNLMIGAPEDLGLIYTEV
ncbi:MAG: N-acetyl-gamma-glutamyl-phosphate reductase [Clostridia bacterium]|nr:N-acetyl-gamma-glutamyl-phosphate reductase [Clostridia bacterium]